jgi:hypothetical protein
MIERDKLARRWIHSHEEDGPEEMVFRPEGFEFPPSRGRRVLDLHPDGSCTEQAPGPTDVPQESAGEWELQDDELVLRGGQEGAGSRAMHVLEADGERLVVRR